MNRNRVFQVEIVINLF